MLRISKRMGDYKLEFMFEGMPVGYFQEPEFPSTDGSYHYMPYRGLGIIAWVSAWGRLAKRDAPMIQFASACFSPCAVAQSMVCLSWLSLSGGHMPMPNNFLETNRRRTSPLSARRKFRSAVHAQHFVFSGGRSANR